MHVSFWLGADLARWGAECPLLTHSRHSASDIVADGCHPVLSFAMCASMRPAMALSRESSIAAHQDRPLGRRVPQADAHGARRRRKGAAARPPGPAIGRTKMGGTCRSHPPKFQGEPIPLVRSTQLVALRVIVHAPLLMHPTSRVRLRARSVHPITRLFESDHNWVDSTSSVLG